MSSRTGQVANGKGKEGGEAMNEAGYQTLIVKFSEPITALDGIFDDAEAWGVDTLKGWIDSYWKIQCKLPPKTKAILPP